MSLADRYRLEEKLGAGGMGEVWKAFDTLLARPVAVKIVLSHMAEDQSNIDRLLAEAKIVAPLQHAGIVVVFDVGEHEGRMFFVMELLNGKNLAQVMASHRRQGLSYDRAALLGERTADALAVAHERNIIHRDIKPANIVVLPGDRPKICDFGVARVIQSAQQQVTSGIGTAAYMAPEQFEGHVDARSDLYALGCVMYEMTTGEQPFLGDSAQLMYKHMTQMPTAPSLIRPTLPSAIEDLIFELMAKDPAERPQHAGEVSERLRAFRGLRASERKNSTDDRPAPLPTVMATPPKATDSRSSARLPDLLRRLDSIGPLTVPLGQDHQGAMVVLDLQESTHFLIGGSIGTHESDPVRAVVATMLARTPSTQVRLALIDSHAGELSRFAEAPHVLPIAGPKVLQWATSELERRYAALRQAKCRHVHQLNEKMQSGVVPPSTGSLDGADDVSYPVIVVLVNELAEVLRAEGAAAEAVIVSLAKVGRAAGIHLVLRTTRPTEQVVTPHIRSYVPARLGLAVPSHDMSLRMLDGSGAESLRLGEGLFKATAASRPRKLDVGVVSDTDIKTVLDGLSTGL
ncbi:serine/threonine protein kinase [Nonomuraea muscovyensis]|uniref:non-specific serine/threonine protein kinase n=1 Tax=Nonomuraea muscovyensis TaxID=1124761 RepID=A0A7X0BYX8_9ACTN|nr:serine/threonine-protein kinase [Nonomuraea muscovyensis]MBB6345253.1 serine/threonine protein kinase [Nonomuraea muscovyensis]